VLDHSTQQVIRYKEHRPEVAFSCTNGRPRLTNHYVGVFEDVAKQVTCGIDNFEYGEQLHRLLYQAENWGS
jgi:hypothetical protein